jgi:hypothetical protein
MPDRGVPSSAAIDRYGDDHHTSVGVRTHTTTQQWQSFEMRMRHRRAERCRLRAEIAIEAGLPDEAREALDEARRLQPELPGLIATEERMAVAKLPQVPAATNQPAVRQGGLAAVVSLALMAGFAGWLMSGEPAAPPASAAAAEFAAPSPVPESTLHTPPANASQVTAEAPGNIAREPAATATPLVMAAPVIEVPPATMPRSTPSPERLALTQTSADFAPSTTVPVPPAAPVPSLPAPAAEVVREPNVRGEPRPEPGRAPSAPSAETKVRAALSRYEAAYSTLNASAARAVWPTVDGNALGRAFDSLQAQQISLSNCTVLVTDQSARANCSGSATWTPKVGGGTRTEPRQWTFDLEQSGDLWEIVRATAR